MSTTVLPNGVRLYWFFQTGCAACEEAEPELRKFLAKHPLVIHMKCNLAKQNWEISGWSPRGTPGYLVKFKGDVVLKEVGALSADQLTQKILDAIGGAH